MARLRWSERLPRCASRPLDEEFFQSFTQGTRVDQFPTRAPCSFNSDPAEVGGKYIAQRISIAIGRRDKASELLHGFRGWVEAADEDLSHPRCRHKLVEVA